MSEPIKTSPRAQSEEKILAQWNKNNIFRKSLEKDSPNGEFVFYDGPPFATGLPHYGSLLSSVTKDTFARFKTMQGYHVRRRWGWDCHGLPIEHMIEKRLELGSKKDIEEMGVAKFNETCRDAVLQYAEDWKWYIDRVGRWVEMDNSYKTMDTSYTESVWWALKQIHNKGLLYEGRKVLLYCPRCETPLAKAEVAMDNSYKDIQEEAVTAKFKVIGQDNTYLLAWTTTPWTLPGNVGLAVGPDVEYVTIKCSLFGNEELYVLAKERLEEVFKGHEYGIVTTQKGSDLVGLAYEPLYEIEPVKNSDKKAWYVMPADFVTTTDGTGIVHTAVIYGEDDYNLGVAQDLPMVPLLDSQAKYLDIAPEFVRGMYIKDAEKLIKRDLEDRGLMFDRKNNLHSYPHCHRCDTPLIYNAISSWFINIQEIKSRLIELNQDIHWIPDHLKEGRFLHTVENAPDWTISRNRFWASPLPIWKGKKTGKEYVMGSIDEMKKLIKSSGNRYQIMRHGEAEKNASNEITTDINDHNPLLPLGEEQAKKAASKAGSVDLIFTSPFMRTRQTADIIANELGLDADAVIVDERLQEIQMGEAEGGNWKDFHENNTMEHQFNIGPEGGESRYDVFARFGEFLYEIEATHQNKSILIVTHGAGIGALLSIVEGAHFDRACEIELLETREYPYGDPREISFVPLPHDHKYQLDLHRPYIDVVQLVAPDGEELERIPEVVDGWVESASMPFAEYHYPFENKEAFESRFPGDYVAEYIAQTRTWFYYMHVMATLLFDDRPFRNVVTTGNILGEDGNKMSKSKGNYTDPTQNFAEFGADTIRYYMLSSVVMQAEDLRFTDRDLVEVRNRLVTMLENVVKFYEMYLGSGDSVEAIPGKTHVLDQWIVARVHELESTMTESMEAFDTVRALRPVRSFVADLSQWYIRRSRDRFKSDDANDRQEALQTTRYVLLLLAKLLAPSMPFLADDIYLRLGGEKESVHLESWPTRGEINEEALEAMQATRDLITRALEMRSSRGIKVRQPLASVTIDTELGDSYGELVKDEVNVKEVLSGDELSLDEVLTPELIQEGRMRELVRSIQALRKKSGLKPEQSIQVAVTANQEGVDVVEVYRDQIADIALASTIVAELDTEQEDMFSITIDVV